MRKFLILTLFLSLTGCNMEGEYIYWTAKTENQIQRLDGASVKYEIVGEEIWVRDKDMSKVLACCS